MQGEAKELNTMEAIEKRISVRGYTAFPSEEQQKKIKEFVENPIEKTPFCENSKEAVRLCYIQDGLGFTSTFGVISGDKHWLCGAIKKEDKFGWENYGFIIEWLIIQCTKLGLGTVWLGGTYRAAPFNDYLKMTDAESLIAVTPVGVPGSSVVGKIFSFVGGSRKRKEWNEMFFNEKFGQPIEKEKIDEKYQKSLEAVRIAPSAMNKQPWKIVKEEKDGITLWHFFRYNYQDFSKIDIGIGMCHWQLACEEVGLKGKWEDKTADLKIEIPKDNIYVKTWVPA